MSRPGGLKPAQPCDADCQSLVLRVKAQIEAKTGENYTTFNPVNYATQVVAGVNYFVKIDVGGGQYVHARIYKDLQQSITLNSVQTGKSRDDPIQYF